VKRADLLARPSRRREFIDKAGDYALYGPADLQAQLRDALVAVRDRVARGAQSDEGDPILGLRATAERALRMNHAEHWQPAMLRLNDGREVEVLVAAGKAANLEGERPLPSIARIRTASIQTALCSDVNATAALSIRGIGCSAVGTTWVLDGRGAFKQFSSPKAPLRARLDHGPRPTNARRRDTSLPPMQGWARNEPPVTDSDAAAFRAGAALAMLDGRARAGGRAQAPFAGAWRRRLALKAAAASARIARRGEDEATLRDAFLLRHGGDVSGRTHADRLARPRGPIYGVLHSGVRRR
jgi:Protein of unknown function (DUF1403)